MLRPAVPKHKWGAYAQMMGQVIGDNSFRFGILLQIFLAADQAASLTFSRFMLSNSRFLISTRPSTIVSLTFALVAQLMRTRIGSRTGIVLNPFISTIAISAFAPTVRRPMSSRPNAFAPFFVAQRKSSPDFALRKY